MTPIQELRRALADYMWSEGCSCCRNTEEHEKAAARLGKLLRVPKYADGSGYNFHRFSTTAAARAPRPARRKAQRANK